MMDLSAFAVGWYISDLKDRHRLTEEDVKTLTCAAVDALHDEMPIRNAYVAVDTKCRDICDARRDMK